MTLFDHDALLGCDYLDRLEIRQGDRDAELEWALRGRGHREVRIYRSGHGFASDLAPDPDQMLVYEGSATTARLAKAAGQGPAYRVSPDIVSYYSIFVRDDGGAWRLQLRVQAEPCSVGRWRRPA